MSIEFNEENGAIRSNCKFHRPIQATDDFRHLKPPGVKGRFLSRTAETQSRQTESQYQNANRTATDGEEQITNHSGLPKKQNGV
jgi:hypothetical protein